MRKSLKFILCLISADIIIISISFLCGLAGVFSTNDDSGKSDKTVLQHNETTENIVPEKTSSELESGYESTGEAVTGNTSDNTTEISKEHFFVLNSTSKVYMRDDASTNGKILCELPANTYGDILDTEGNWTKIFYDNKTGYVFSEYIITGASAEDMIQQLSSSKIIINKSCYIRNTPDTGSPVIGNAIAGTIYQYIVSQSDEQWYAIIMPDGSTAYISTGYADKTE